MKHAKKLASMLLALVMVLSLSVTAFAAQEGELTDGSITINDAVVGQTYKVYQLLYLESYSTDENGTSTGAYAYKANSAWADWLKTQTAYVSIDAQGYVTWVENASAADFAKAAQAYAKDNNIAPDADAVTAESTTVSFTGLKLGYYLVDTTLGTLCSLDTTNPNVVMEEKNEAPSNVKTVEEDSTGNYGEKNDADIGQTVNYKSTVTLPKGSEHVTFHDTMSTGLTLDATSIKVYTDANMTTELAAGNYTVTTSGLTDGCTFEVSFNQTYLDSLTATATVYVKYSATVNENAVVAGEGNSNTSKLSYGDSSNTKTTPDSTTKTYTWDVDIFKYAKDGETEKALAGAKFTLSKSADGTNPIALVAEGNNVYRVAKTGETGITEITTDATGKFTIKGLDSDTYYLTETVAPAGYNKLADPITIVVGEDGKTSVDSTVVDEVKVLNNTGAELPSTGGMGTTIFYIVGGVLVLGAAILLITKKRMGADR